MKTLPFLILPLLLLVYSCSREDVQSDDGSCNRIVQVQWISPYDAPLPPATFRYDDSGRLKSVERAGYGKLEYAYYRDSIKVKEYSSTGNVHESICLLDGAGRIERTPKGDNFRYNAEGYLVAVEAYYYWLGRQFLYTLQYENGNLVAINSADPAAPMPPTAFTYYGVPNQELMGLNSPLYEGRIVDEEALVYLIPGGYFGKPSRHLLNTGARYRFDAQSRIVAITDRYSFTYQCP